MTSINEFDPKTIYKQRLQKFKQSHTLYVIFLIAILVLQIIAIAFFGKGFLLSRTVLSDINEVHVSQFDASLNKKFDKAVILVVDALRFDFVIPVQEPLNNSFYHNNIKVLYDQILESEKNGWNNSLLLKFIADPPTTTLQRLKGLTTGSLPTFIDAGSNFDGSVIEEDNLIKQLYLNNKRVNFVGDDTWDSLFHPFLSNSSKPFESLNVWDLDTVDNGVISYFNNYLIDPKTSEHKNWDVLVGHMLGIDHVGHKYGPNHFTMREKQLQVDKFISDVIKSIDDRTLLVIMGDHGMDHTGNHGGDSQDELESTLFLYSKQTNVWTLKDSEYYNIENYGSNYRSINQIDLVPTLSLLLDIPIPFNSLGWPIDEIATSEHEQTLFHTTTLKQLRKYQEVYNLVSEGSNEYQVLQKLYETNESNLRKSAEYQKELLKICKDMWATFDYFSITLGIILLTISLIILITTTKLIPSIVVSQMIPKYIPLIFIMIVVSNLCLHSFFYVFQYPHFLGNSFWTSMLGVAIGIIIASISQILDRYSIKWILFRFIGEASDYWSRIALLILTLHAILFTSNSFTIWEDRIVTFLLVSFGALALYEFSFVPKRQSTSSLLCGVESDDCSDSELDILVIKDDRLPLSKTSRLLGAYHSLNLIVCTRLASLITICREEQGSSCVPTFTTANNYSYTVTCISLFLMLMTPSSIKAYYENTRSYQGAATSWIGYFLRAFLVVNFIFWSFTVLENSLSDSTFDFSIYKLTLARTLAGFSLIALNVGWAMGPLCVKLTVEGDKITGNNNASLIGSQNIYGSQLFLLVLNVFMSTMIFSKPLAQISLFLMLNQILSVVEIIDLFKLKENIIGPFALTLVAYQQFFSTGHQATIPSVQWDVGFFLGENITFPFTHIAISLNSFGTYIIVAIAVALLTLWQQQPDALKPQTILGRIVSNCGGILIYNTVLCLSSFVWVTHFRRHLMVWKIFCPRYLFACMVLVVTGFTVTFITIAFASRRVIKQVNRLFWS